MRVLIVSPHADDEVLGCGGMIARRVAEGHHVDVAVVTVADVYRGDELKSSMQTRVDELGEACRILGATNLPILLPGHENRLDTVPMIDLMGKLDALLVETPYDQVFVPYPSHHQDHRRVFEAAFGALREKGRPGPSLVAQYEYPYVGWSPEPIAGGRYYVDVTDHLSAKRDALAAYASQAYAAPHPIAWESVEALARQRGAECGRAHAELFYVLKMVDA